jgi:hypothetical protein
MTPDELYQISKSDYKCWCLDSSIAAGLNSWFLVSHLWSLCTRRDNILLLKEIGMTWCAARYEGFVYSFCCNAKWSIYSRSCLYMFVYISWNLKQTGEFLIFYQAGRVRNSQDPLFWSWHDTNPPDQKMEKGGRYNSHELGTLFFSFF